MSNSTTLSSFLSPGGIHSIGTIGFSQCGETLTSSSPIVYNIRLLACQLGDTVIYTSQNLKKPFWIYTPLKAEFALECSPSSQPLPGWLKH